MKCPRCGANVPNGATACGSCGAKFQQGKRCPNCQSVIPANAAVCPKCGARFAAQPSLPPAAPTPFPQKTKSAVMWKNILLAALIFFAGFIVGTVSSDREEPKTAPRAESSSRSFTHRESATTQSSSEESKIEPTSAPDDPDVILSQLETTQYSYTSMGFQYAFLKIKNNSSTNLNITVDSEFYDADGNLVGVDQNNQEAFESGSTILLYDMPREDYERVEYKITAKTEDLYECVISELSYEAHETESKVILDVKNNGAKPAEFIQGSVLFFRDGEISGYDSQYFTDDDYELKPGESIKQEFNCFDGYDSYEVFLTGRRTK